MKNLGSKGSCGLIVAVVVFLSMPFDAWALNIQVANYQKLSSLEGNMPAIADGDEIGNAVAFIGDLDSDGINDIAVGEQKSNNGGENTGVVWILFLNPDATVKNYQKIGVAAGNFTGSIDADDLFGHAIAPIGDLDGDGVIDIAVSATGDDDGGTDCGAVWILFLNSNGTVKSHQKISNSEGGFTGTLNSGDWFGNSISTVDDLDGDSVTEIAVGATGDDEGAVWILFLNSNGTVKSQQKISDTQGGFTNQLQEEDGFGSSVCSVDDLDGDNLSEIVVGAGGADEGGAIWVLYLNSDGTAKSYQKIGNNNGQFTGQLDAGDNFGSSLTCMGDLDTDGVNDIAVGACSDDDGGTDRGALWFLLLNNNGTVKECSKVSDTEGGFLGNLDNGDEFGISAACIEDFDNDGYVDIVTGARFDDDGGTDRGAAWVLFLRPFTTYHIDTVNGSNSDNGFSKETAFATIQKGIDEAANGDTVLVWPGIYNESLFFINKAITVKSAADAAIIEASDVYGVSFYTAEEEDSILRNFVIRSNDTAIFVSSGSPTLKNLTITNCYLAIEANAGAEPNITNCIFSNNDYHLYQCQAQYSCFYEADAIDDMVSYWKFDEDDGSIADDSFGSNDGSLINGPIWSTGQVGSAINLDGFGAHVFVSDVPELDGMDELTVMAWIKTLDTSEMSILSKFLHNNLLELDDSYYLGLLSSGVVRFQYAVGSSTPIKDSSISVADGQWHHIVGVYTGQEGKIYIDGTEAVLSRNDPDASGTINNTTEPVYMGGTNDNSTLSRFFNGLIDEVVIFARALPPEEIETNCQLGLFGRGLQTDSLFADPNNNDYHLKSKRGRYWPTHNVWVLDKSTSSWIDAGNPDDDSTEEPTPNGNRVNIGAYGGSTYASLSLSYTTGDVNQDGTVDMKDLAILADNWLKKTQ